MYYLFFKGNNKIKLKNKIVDLIINNKSPKILNNRLIKISAHD